MGALRIDYDMARVGDVAAGLRAAPQRAARIAAAAMWRASLLVEREVKERTPVNAGTLRASIAAREPEITPDGLVGLVGTPLAYAAPVEDGSQPHRPPLQPLEDWAASKLGLAPEEAKDVAWRIAWKIAQHGTAPVGMFKHGFAAAESQVERIFDLAARKIADGLGTPA